MRDAARYNTLYGKICLFGFVTVALAFGCISQPIQMGTDSGDAISVRTGEKPMASVMLSMSSQDGRIRKQIDMIGRLRRDIEAQIRLYGERGVQLPSLLSVEEPFDEEVYWIQRGELLESLAEEEEQLEKNLLTLRKGWGL